MAKKRHDHGFEIHSLDDLTRSGNRLAKEAGIELIEIYPLFAGLAGAIKKIIDPNFHWTDMDELMIVARRYAAAAIIGYELEERKMISILSADIDPEKVGLTPLVGGKLVYVRISRNNLKVQDAGAKGEMFERIYETLKLHFDPDD